MPGYDVTPPPARLASRVQFRIAFSTDSGEVTRFLAQLEYWRAGEWQEIVRYDHDSEAAGGHDVEAEGLHRDVFRDGSKYRTELVLEGISANEALEYAEDDLRENVERYTQRFERWHEVDRGKDL